MSDKKKELRNEAIGKAIDEIVKRGAKELLNLKTSIPVQRRIELLDLALQKKLNPPEKNENESEQPFED